MDEMKFSLGNERYLVVSKWKGQTVINVREYQSYVGSDKLYPTKKGIALTVENWLDLKMAFDDINKELVKVSAKEKVDFSQHIGRNIRASVLTDWPGVDIRQWWLPENAEKVVPTKKGIRLIPEEWEKLTKLAETLHRVLPELAYAIPCSLRGDHQNQQGMLSCSHCNPNDYATWNSL